MTCVGQCGRCVLGVLAFSTLSHNCCQLSNTPLLLPEQRDAYLKALPLWSLADDGKSIQRSFTARNFVAAQDFFNRVGQLAEAETHHPDFHLTNYRDVRLVLSTHAVRGLTQPDCILAAKIDAIEVDYSPKWLEAHPEAKDTARLGTEAA